MTRHTTKTRSANQKSSKVCFETKTCATTVTSTSTNTVDSAMNAAASKKNPTFKLPSMISEQRLQSTTSSVSSMNTSTNFIYASTDKRPQRGCQQPITTQQQQDINEEMKKLMLNEHYQRQNVPQQQSQSQGLEEINKKIERDSVKKDRQIM